jgi:chromosome segregation protein
MPMLRLAQVELLGFKSFPHKTVFDLDRGVTCVVGPNGSGKSNLADAINFAFGNQSGKELRASRLTSLIFAGTEQIRPLNIASVTLHFEYTGDSAASRGFDGAAEAALLGNLSLLDESDSDPPAPAAGSGPTGGGGTDTSVYGYGGRALTRHIAPGSSSQPQERTPTVLKLLQDLQPGARLSLTRRVFRDGTAGYYINGDNVRLKDVDELFNRFNLGRSAVFSINQGEVEKKILGTPQEMREWLAEATGVALLLQHKSRAQQKLKRTQQNLERLEDIRGNTRTLVADLAGQRTAAEEHLRLKAQLRGVELNEIRREVEYAQRQQESAAKALFDAQGALNSAQTELEQARRAAHAAHEQRAALETQLEAGERELSGGQERQAQLKQEAALAAQAVAAHAQAAQRARHDIEELGAQLGSMDAEIERAEERRVEARAVLESAAATARKLADQRAAAQTSVSSVLNSQNAQRGQLLEAAAQAARLHNQLEAADRHLRGLAAQLEAREQQAGAASSRLALLEAELEDEQHRSEAFALGLGEQREALDQHALELARLREQQQAADEHVVQMRRQLAELSARRQTIAELAEQSDQAAGPLALLADNELAAQLSRVTDITFPPMYRAAFTRLLAHAGDALAGPPQQRSAAAALLADQSAEALWLDRSDPGEALHPESLWRQIEAPVGLLGGLVSLLGDVLLADDFEAAQQLLDHHSGVRWAVLSDGSAMLGRGHAYLGQPAPERALRVAKRSDMAYLDTQLANTQTELEGAEAHLLALRESQAQLQRLRDEAAAGLAAAEAQLNSQLALCDRLHRTLEERRTDLQFQQTQAEDLRSEQERVAAEQPRLAEQHASALEHQKSVEAAGRELEHALTAAEQALDAARRTEAEASARRGLAEQQAQHLETQLFDLAERRHNARVRLDGLQARVAEHEQAQRNSEETAAQSTASAAALVEHLAELAAQVERQRGERHALAESSGAAQQAVEAAAHSVSRAEQDSYRAENLRDNAIERVANWLEQLREKYGMTLTELLADPAVTGESRWDAGLTPVAAASDDTGAGEAAPSDRGFESALSDPHEAGRLRLRDAKQRITLALEELGPVNLLAIEQHQQHSQRLVFLDSQAAELERAAGSLEQLIRDLDQGTEERYGSALKRIETRFGELFTTLFSGGSARLRFETPENIVESGVEVEVQLPGSRKMALRSLSGGQRSLIFLSLFFAVHSVRSPGFCILDEADAALDDANVKRYTQLIQRFASEEQFIVVTHNKQTMEVADRLIGVVGRPKGVSNLLAVDLKKAQKLAEQSAGAA